MRRRLALVAAAIVILAAPFEARGTGQKPRWIPVEVEYTAPPADLKAGDEVTTVFSFTATRDVPILEVELTALDGVAILEGAAKTTYETVRSGERRDLKVKVQLTAARGELSVVVRARFGRQFFGDSILVKYGQP